MENISFYPQVAEHRLILAIIVFDKRRCPFELHHFSSDSLVHMFTRLCSITSVFHHVSQM